MRGSQRAGDQWTKVNYATRDDIRSGRYASTWLKHLSESKISCYGMNGPALGRWPEFVTRNRMLLAQVHQGLLAAEHLEVAELELKAGGVRGKLEEDLARLGQVGGQRFEQCAALLLRDGHK